MALQRYGVGDCEGGMRHDLEPMAHGDYVKAVDVDDMEKKLKTAITALKFIAEQPNEVVEDNPSIRFAMYEESQKALREMKLLT